MMPRILSFGVLFGFVLSRVGATEYDAIFAMFALRDLHLAGVMAVAIAGLALGFGAVRRRSLTSMSGQALTLQPKAMTPGLVLGGLLFGVGWAVSGTCPGTALAQLGEGRLSALATVAGILLSSTLVEAWQARSASKREVATSS